MTRTKHGCRTVMGNINFLSAAHAQTCMWQTYLGHLTTITTAKTIT